MNVQVARLSLLNGTRRATYPEIGEVASKRGTLYILVEVSAREEEWDSISRQLVDKAIEAFVVHKGPDTAALKEVAATLNGFLLELNAERSREDAIWAGVNGVFMREGEMYLLQAGPALTYIARGSSVTRFPKSIDESVFAPLGEEDVVESRLARFALQADDIVAMTGSFLPSHVSEENLNEAMRRATVDDVTDGLADLAQTELSSLVVQYEPTATMIDPESFIPTTGRQPTAAEPAQPSAAPPKPVGGKKDYSTNPPRPRAAEPAAPSTRTRKAGNRPVNPSSAPSGNSPAAQNVDAATPTGPDLPPGSPVVGDVPAAAPSLRARFVQDDGLQSTHPEEHADTFVALPPQEEAPPTNLPRARAKPAPSPSPPADEPARQPDTIPGVARKVEPAEPPARQGRKKAEPPRQPPAALPMPPFTTAGVATFDAPAAPGAPPIARQVGALLMAMLSALLGALAAGIAWISRSLAPRVASSGGVLDRLAHGFWWLVDEVTMAGRRIMNQMLPGDRPDPARPARQPAPARGDGSAFLRTLVILVPLLFGLAAVGVWFFGDEESAPAFSINRTGEATYESLVTEAQALINQAGNVDPATAQELIARALPLLDQASTLAQGESETAAIEALRAQAASLLALASPGTAVVPQPIVTFAAPLTATELVYGGNAVYLIDPARGALYRLLPDQPPATDLAAIRPLLTAGERLAAGVEVGTPYQMTWIPAGGGRAGDGLLALTREGQMFDFDVASSLLRQVAFAPVTGNIVASEGYGGNVYYLDVSAKQIWKYVPDGAGEYPAAPEPWLTETGQGQLGNPIDMAIDGYIFLLDQSGEVRRFQVGEAKAGFALDPVTPPLTQPVALAKVPPEATDLFVADAQRVVRFDPNGRFVAEYRAAPGSDWGAIRDIAINERNDTLYVLSDTGVYRVDVSEE